METVATTGNVFDIEPVGNDPRRLSQAVLQIAAMLGLYQAELARILGMDCPAIGQLASGRSCLRVNTPQWDRACLLVRCYRALYQGMHGDGPAMCHWLHVRQPSLDGVPHRLLVDEQRLPEVVACLEAGLCG